MTTVRIAALFYGIAFLAVGIAWYLPFLFDNGLLFGFFQVDSMHNKIHLASGLIALAATSSASLSKLYLKAFGSIYALLGILGFIFQDAFLSMQINTADNILHIVLGLIAVLLGFKIRLAPNE